MLNVQARGSTLTEAKVAPDLPTCHYVTTAVGPLLQVLTGQSNIINSPLQQYLNPILLKVAQAVDFLVLGQILPTILEQRRDDSVLKTISAFTSAIFQLHTRYRSAPAVQDKQDGMRACAKAMAEALEKACADWQGFAGHTKGALENLCR